LDANVLINNCFGLNLNKKIHSRMRMDLNMGNELPIKQ
jgi:hypothetical protein